MRKLLTKVYHGLGQVKDTEEPLVPVVSADKVFDKNKKKTEEPKSILY